MARLGCFLQIIGMMALCLLVILPGIFGNYGFFDNLLETLLCPDGEIHAERNQIVHNDGSTSYTTTLYCEDSEGHETNVTAMWTGIAYAAFLLPFLLGLFMMMRGYNKSERGIKRFFPLVQGYNPKHPQ
jgi:hypothetical protein